MASVDIPFSIADDFTPEVPYPQYLHALCVADSLPVTGVCLNPAGYDGDVVFTFSRALTTGETSETTDLEAIVSGYDDAAGVPPVSDFASGDLTGTLKEPTVAALTTTTGPTSLVVGAIADGETLVRDGSTLVGQAAAVSVYGSELNRASSLGESEQDTQAFSTKARIPASGDITLPAGDYGLYVWYGWRYDGASTDFIGTIEQDGATLGVDHQEEPQDVGSDQVQYVSRYEEFTLVAGDYNWSVRFKPGGFGVRAFMRQCRMKLIKIAD